jgi:hypothetical protein
VGFFSGGKKRQGGSPIAEFWEWWVVEGERQLTVATATGQYSGVARTISRRVAAIHPELQWETSEGRNSSHALCVTAGGIADLRRLAERWLRAAPPTTHTWEFAAARRRRSDAAASTLEIGGIKIELGDARIGIDADRDRLFLDVAVFHPAFGTLTPVESAEVAFLLLDWLLGEDDVERWVSGIDPVVNNPNPSIAANELPAVVDLMAADRGEPGWTLTELVAPDGGRVLASRLQPMRWIDYPLFDLHTEIQIPYAPKPDDGLPTTASLEMLRAFEDDLVTTLGPRGLLLAHETSKGTRVFHCYTDSEDQNARDILDGLRPESGTTHHTLDATWLDLRRFG